jgi:hypothetical protein
MFLGLFLVEFSATRVCAWFMLGEVSKICNFFHVLNAYGIFYLFILKLYFLCKP